MVEETNYKIQSNPTDRPVKASSPALQSKSEHGLTQDEVRQQHFFSKTAACIGSDGILAGPTCLPGTSSSTVVRRTHMSRGVRTSKQQRWILRGVQRTQHARRMDDVRPCGV